MGTDSPPLPPVKRQRHDGWTLDRQLIFLDELRRSRNVSRAAEAAGMNRKSAYRLRERPAGAKFAAAWDRTLRITAPPAHRTPALAGKSHTEGLTAGHGTRIRCAPSLGNAPKGTAHAIRATSSTLSISERDFLASGLRVES